MTFFHLKRKFCAGNFDFLHNLIYCAVMSLKTKFSVGQQVYVRTDSDPFPNGPSHQRTGVDCAENYPIHADIRGLPGEVVRLGNLPGDHRLVIRVKVGNRDTNFLVPAQICE